MFHDAIEVLGWTLLHFVWQGCIVGLIMAGALAAMRRCSANTRYLAGVVSLSVMSALPVLTFCWSLEEPSNLAESPIVAWKSFVEVPDPSSETGTTMAERIGVDFENPPPPDAIPIRLEPAPQADRALGLNHWSWQPYLAWIVSVWLAGVVVLSLRLLCGWLSTQRVRRRSSKPASDSWQAVLRCLAERLQVTRPVQLVESALVEVPAVIGWLRPVILLPATAVTGLTAEQLEALLAHELAHVRRHDYLVNLLQTIVETLLFYHPAVWWLSHRIRVEREHCCDDLAASICGDRLSYAKALVAMEELRGPKLGVAMSANGGDLLHRVARLLGRTDQQRAPIGWVSGLIGSLLTTVTVALGAGLLTPPEKRIEGLANAGSRADSNSNEQSKETSAPEQRRGQETGAEREEGESEDRIIATVNGLTIREAEVTARYFEHLVRLREQTTREEYRKKIDDLIRRDLRAYVDLKLLVSAATKFFNAEQKQKLDDYIKREMKKQFAAAMKDSGTNSLEELQNWLRKRGSSLTAVENQFRDKIYSQQFLALKLDQTKTPEEQKKQIADVIQELWQKAEIKSEFLQQTKAEVCWVNQERSMVWISLSVADGIKPQAKFKMRRSGAPNAAPIERGRIEVIRIIDAHTCEARILESQNNGPAKGDEVIPLEESCRFVGRMRLKTEKPLPDLEQVEVPTGKVLDESLVFSKDGGLANVFVYLWKPNFAMEPIPSDKPSKPFVLIAEDGKLWPHAAVLRTQRAVVFENRFKEPTNFHFDPLRNVSFNVLVKMQDHVRLQAFKHSENFPFVVKSSVHPWMQSYLLPLDHPFAAVTDEDGRFEINGLPPGEHEFRVWHERAGWLEKSLKITIKPGEETASELIYEPKQFKLEEADIVNWDHRWIDSVRKPMLQRQAPPPADAERSPAE